MSHVHRPYLNFDLNSVRCTSLGCKDQKVAATELQKALPDGAKVTFVNHRLPDVHRPMVYAVQVGDQYWCTMTDIKGGVLRLNEFKGSEVDFKVFQEALDTVFGIYAIQIDSKVFVFSVVAP